MANYAVISGEIVQNVYVADIPMNEGDILTTDAAPGWFYSNGSFAPPNAGNSPIIPLVISAREALDSSDKTILRCVENGVVVTPAWPTYRTALRHIIDGSDTTSTALPVRPDFPVGT